MEETLEKSGIRGDEAPVFLSALIKVIALAVNAGPKCKDPFNLLLRATGWCELLAESLVISEHLVYLALAGLRLNGNGELISDRIKEALSVRAERALMNCKDTFNLSALLNEWGRFEINRNEAEKGHQIITGCLALVIHGDGGIQIHAISLFNAWVSSIDLQEAALRLQELRYFILSYPEVTFHPVIHRRLAESSLDEAAIM